MKRFLGISTVLLAMSVSAQAVTVTYPDFSDTTGLMLNGHAAVVNNGIDANPVLRLVPATTNRSGSFFSSTTINSADFSTKFQFRITNPGGIHDGTDTGADGLVFVVQPVSSSIGGAGGGMGYSGINPSLGVEFDTWQNGWDPNSNHIGIDTNGNVSSLQTLGVAPRFDDGNLWTAWVDYDGTTLEIRANQTGIRPVAPLMSRVIDIPTLISTNNAYVGFTAGTGSAYGNHDIVNWTYFDTFRPIDAPRLAVPEPASMGLCMLAMGALGMKMSRRRQP